MTGWAKAPRKALRFSQRSTPDGSEFEPITTWEDGLATSLAAWPTDYCHLPKAESCSVPSMFSSPQGGMEPRTQTLRKSLSGETGMS